MSKDIVYLVFANGLRARSRDLFDGRMVEGDSELGLADYVIAVKGLPEEFFTPPELHRHKIYYCTNCKRPISESEMEQKYGCFAHAKTFNEKVIERWRTDVFERYDQPRIDWMTPAFRFWMNNVQGEEKFREIWEYIKSHHPAEKLLPLPVPIGNLRETTITQSKVPLIDLLKFNANSNDTLNQKVVEHKITEIVKYMCHKCGKEFESRKALIMHMNVMHDAKKKKKVEETKTELVNTE